MTPDHEQVAEERVEDNTAWHPIYAPGVDPAIRREYEDLKATTN